MSTERRSHDRESRLVNFRCTVDGQKFDGQALNLSTGGALLRTEEAVRMGAVVLVVPDRELRRKLPVALAGIVVRKQKGVPLTYGVQWQKCVTRDGIQRVYDFLAFYLNLFPANLPLPSPEAYAAECVEFDFRYQEFRATE